jgi:hypothetical protein
MEEVKMSDEQTRLQRALTEATSAEFDDIDEVLRVIKLQQLKSRAVVKVVAKVFSSPFTEPGGTAIVVLACDRHFKPRLFHFREPEGFTLSSFVVGGVEHLMGPVPCVVLQDKELYVAGSVQGTIRVEAINNSKTHSCIFIGALIGEEYEPVQKEGRCL